MLTIARPAAPSREQRSGTRQYRRPNCECPICGEHFAQRGGIKTTTCSRACGYVFQFGRGPSCKVPKIRQPRQRKEPEKRTAPPFDCTICGTHVIPGQNGVHCQTRLACSKKCKRRVHAIRRRENGTKQEAKHRYRARKRGAYVAPVSRKQIFERDRYLCKLCNQPVMRHECVPHPLAPVIDHILPLAKGGTHEPANVQCAHFLCNSAKSDGVSGSGEQLALLGGGL